MDRLVPTRPFHWLLLLVSITRVFQSPLHFRYHASLQQTDCSRKIDHILCLHLLYQSKTSWSEKMHLFINCMQGRPIVIHSIIPSVNILRIIVLTRYKVASADATYLFTCFPYVTHELIENSLLLFFYSFFTWFFPNLLLMTFILVVVYFLLGAFTFLCFFFVSCSLDHFMDIW